MNRSKQLTDIKSVSGARALCLELRALSVSREELDFSAPRQTFSYCGITGTLMVIVFPLVSEPVCLLTGRLRGHLR